MLQFGLYIDELFFSFVVSDKGGIRWVNHQFCVFNVFVLAFIGVGYPVVEGMGRLELRTKLLWIFKHNIANCHFKFS